MGSSGNAIPASFCDDGLERRDQADERVAIEIGVDRELALLEQVVQRLFEEIAGNVEDDLAEHLHEAAVRVVREALVAGLAREAADRLVVEAEVEDGVHHPRHRERCTGAHRHEQRVDGVAEPLAHLLLELRERGVDLVEQTLGERVVELHVRVARLGRDREPGRHRQAEDRHLGEVGALAAEQVLLLLRAFFEAVDVLGHWSGPPAHGSDGANILVT